jgi:hypothetical protein
MIRMPREILTHGGVGNRAADWVHKNVDPWVSGQALNKVIEVMSLAGDTGVDINDLAWLIKHYSPSTSGGDKPYNAGGGVRVR